MEARAIAKSLRVSPIRARLISDMIRGKNVSEALTILSNVNNKSARLTKKVLDSAIANAVNNEGADAATLYIKEARVDAGPVMKRHMGIRPTVRGSVMNPNDHPHGGGEGRAPIGRKAPVTPWGKPALGYKTRKKKQSDKFIVRRRNGK